MDLLRCRLAMVSLADSYNSYLERQLDKPEFTFQKLKKEGTNNLELVGETIAELKPD
jgi:hypothetical protein